MNARKKIWFTIFNVIQTIAAVFLSFGLLITIFNGYKYGGRISYAQVITVLITFFIICNTCYNLFLAAKYKKGVVQRKFKWALSILSLCFSGIIMLLILLITCYGAYEEFFDGSSNEDITGKIMVFVFIAWSILSALIFVWQLQLINEIKRTNKLQVELLIDSIGSEVQNNI